MFERFKNAVAAAWTTVKKLTGRAAVNTVAHIAEVADFGLRVVDRTARRLPRQAVPVVATVTTVVAAWQFGLSATIAGSMAVSLILCLMLLTGRQVFGREVQFSTLGLLGGMGALAGAYAVSVPLASFALAALAMAHGFTLSAVAPSHGSDFLASGVFGAIALYVGGLWFVGAVITAWYAVIRGVWFTDQSPVLCDVGSYAAWLCRKRPQADVAAIAAELRKPLRTLYGESRKAAPAAPTAPAVADTETTTAPAADTETLGLITDLITGAPVSLEALHDAWFPAAAKFVTSLQMLNPQDVDRAVSSAAKIDKAIAAALRQVRTWPKHLVIGKLQNFGKPGLTADQAEFLYSAAWRWKP